MREMGNRTSSFGSFFGDRSKKKPAERDDACITAQAIVNQAELR